MGGTLKPVAFLAKCLGDENRLRILLSLNNGKKSVNQLAEELELSQPLVSHHLKELRRALLLKIERRGPFIFYEMTDPQVLQIVEALNGLAARLLADRTLF
ncbi:MAG: metalloregulator ArsR/SmtB family transcription factor [Desulfobaccales bacterium]